MDNQDSTPVTKDDLKSFVTKADLDAFSTKYGFKSFATKADLEAFAAKYDFNSFATKKDFATLKEAGAETRRMLAMLAVNTQAGFRELKETMSNKADIDRLFNLLDASSGRTQTYERDTLLHGQVLTEVQVELREHDQRIKRLESGS